MMTPSATLLDKVVVLGIGNTLRSDEGVGIHVLHRLISDYRLARHVCPIDGGVMGLELLPHLEGCSSLLIIDAIDAGQPPGSVLRLVGEDVPAIWEQKLSMHQAGLADILAILRMQDMFPSRLVVWGIQPAVIDWSLVLSAAVAASFDQLLNSVVEELRSWRAIDA